MVGLLMIGSISLGMAFVAGRKRVPSPAAGMITFFTFFIALTSYKVGGDMFGNSIWPDSWRYQEFSIRSVR
ncbi:hypothetical protein D3C80_1812880 [compost metagenome]